MERVSPHEALAHPWLQAHLELRDSLGMGLGM